MDEQVLWEYRVRSFGGALRAAKDEQIEVELNRWGEEGWEVLAAAPREGTFRLMVVARRPLTLEARRRRTRPGGWAW